MTCKIDGCDRKHKARGWCHTHYIRWYRHGDPSTTLQVSDGAPFSEHFARYADLSGECWLWLGSLDGKGYGQVRSVPPVAAHRASYEEFVGPIPDGLELDHLCRTRNCVNPDHLEPVTHEENMRRARKVVVNAS